MKKLVIVTAALVAAVAVLVVGVLPRRRLSLVPFADGTIPGLLHIHTNRSDGLSGPDAIAAAAARAGLKFVVFTDHGDATRPPDPPAYRSGVLCLDGVEISTTGGHYVALDLPAAPYPLGGEARDVVDDVRRLGGFGIAAHPDSPKDQLRWADWTLPFDGVELLNPDTSWRMWAREAGGAGGPIHDTWHARGRLAAALLTYPFRPSETIASLVLPDGAAVARWAGLTARRRVVAIAGVDAHANLDLHGDPADSGYSLPIPGYEPSFRTLSIHAATDAPVSGNAQADAATLVRAIRNGHLYVAVDAIATPASFDFTATNAHGTVHEGDELTVGGPVTLRIRSNAPSPFTATVWNGGTVIASDHREPAFTVEAPEGPAAYWVEIRSTDRSRAITWIRSNPIYVRGTDAPLSRPARPPAATDRPMFDGASAAGWRVEHDATSLAEVDTSATPDARELRFRYGLSGGALVGQVAALVFDTRSGIAPNDRLMVTVRADRPMRFSVQLRAGIGDAAGDRWQRSVYVDTTDQEQTVFFDDFSPVGATHVSRPALDTIRSLLFVVDTTNTKPGTSGRLWIKKAALQR